MIGEYITYVSIHTKVQTQKVIPVISIKYCFLNNFLINKFTNLVFHS